MKTITQLLLITGLILLVCGLMTLVSTAHTYQAFKPTTEPFMSGREEQ